MIQFFIENINTLLMYGLILLYISSISSRKILLAIPSDLYFLSSLTYYSYSKISSESFFDFSNDKNSFILLGIGLILTILTYISKKIILKNEDEEIFIKSKQIKISTNYEENQIPYYKAPIINNIQSKTIIVPKSTILESSRIQTTSIQSHIDQIEKEIFKNEIKIDEIRLSNIENDVEMLKQKTSSLINRLTKLFDLLSSVAK